MDSDLTPGIVDEDYWPDASPAISFAEALEQVGGAIGGAFSHLVVPWQKAREGWGSPNADPMRDMGEHLARAYAVPPVMMGVIDPSAGHIHVQMTSDSQPVFNRQGHSGPGHNPHARRGKGGKRK